MGCTLSAGSPATGSQSGDWRTVRSTDFTVSYQQEALEIYRTLISMRTAAGHGQVPTAIAYLAEQLRAAGFPDADIHQLPFTTPTGEAAASLVVRFRGDGSSSLAPVLFVAHVDVVDALQEDWVRNPFVLTEEDGFFFGRGTSDDKFGVAQLISIFVRLHQEGFVPARDLILAITGDEETDQLSVRDLVHEHRDLIDAEFALNADAGGGRLNSDFEPESFLVQVAEKTYATFELTVTNPGGHSSAPRNDNAIYQLTDALLKLRAYRFPVRTNEATLSYFKTVAALRGGKVGEALRRLAEDPADEEAAEVLWNEPAEVGVTRTTCIPTLLRAGHAENALPQSATATLNCRIFPGTEVAEVRSQLQRAVADPAVQFAVLGDPVSSAASPTRDDVMHAVRAGVERIHAQTPILPYMAPYTTDGVILRGAGIPTYGIMGLFSRSEDSGEHGLDERVPVRAFFDALEFWNVVLRELGTVRKAP
jgi:acetylornithine deacetylase/succinyl-diaminopimelate desuccinylase-like protein